MGSGGYPSTPFIERKISEMTFKTVEQMQDEIEQLRVDYKEAFIDGAAEERTKIVAWLRDKGLTAVGYLARVTLKTSANDIEDGEHLE